MTAESEGEVLRILNGNKISSFYLNLLHPNKETRVTIDRHAIACMTQKVDDVKPLEDGQYSMTDKQYVSFEQVFKDVSDELNLCAHQVQAITWVSYRKLRGLN
jgi:thermostable 8-oxoguanine DNA glycosylase